MIWPDHPRGCGEGSAAPAPACPWPGSSPRVRGRGAGSIDCHQGIRIIPAGAGKGAGARPLCSLGTDHPRGCGEGPEPTRAAASMAGSSPRVRGRVQRAKVAQEAGRIIPAGAGKGRKAVVDYIRKADHPRGCGEGGLLRKERINAGGSSPRVRGREAEQERIEQARRIIPAGAGKGPRTPGDQSMESDHPRGCGEGNRVSCWSC